MQMKQLLASFLENLRKVKFLNEDAETANLVVDDMNDDGPQYRHFDWVCAICDNGGEIICCEGKCFRSFHATVESGLAGGNNCKSLGLPPERLTGRQPFLCENCLYNLHQCFVCSELGSSDKSSGAEVFRCSCASCGHFYHPGCVARLLQQDGEAGAQDLEEKIGVGEAFICPAHKCGVCKQTENANVIDLQFAICRRCPTSYHRKCLPREIMFDYEAGDDDIPRAWDGLLPKSRAMIFCLQHEIEEELGTPARNLKFEDIDMEQPSEVLSS